MEAIGSLAGGIAHDFNNILLVIRGYSARLLGELGDEQRESVQHIDRAAERAAEFTHQLLAFSRQQVLLPQATNLNALVEETLQLVGRMLGEDIEVAVKLDPNLKPTLIDGGQLTQAILNLIVNARDAMPDGGTLTIRTANIDLDEAYAATHDDVAAGSYVMLQVTDSGSGTDALDQARVFDPFFTTKEHGTGLGLAGVFGLVKQSRGHIWLYSEPGVGTSFKLYFPVTTEMQSPLAERDDVGSLQGTETILLVEDNDMVRTLVTSTLQSYGYTVIAAADGADALAIPDEDMSAVSLLMTDVVMPGISGGELAEALLARDPDFKVLFTSGYPADTVTRRGISDAPANFLEKPYRPGPRTGNAACRAQRGMFAAKRRSSSPALQKEKPRIGTTTRSIAAGGPATSTTRLVRAPARRKSPKETPQRRNAGDSLRGPSSLFAITSQKPRHALPIAQQTVAAAGLNPTMRQTSQEWGRARPWTDPGAPS
jgi:two-component system, cell cycle sensor histidine kinase and response regulator CckA